MPAVDTSLTAKRSALGQRAQRMGSTSQRGYESSAGWEGRRAGRWKGLRRGLPRQLPVPILQPSACKPSVAALEARQGVQWQVPGQAAAGAAAVVPCGVGGRPDLHCVASLRAHRAAL